MLLIVVEEEAHEGRDKVALRMTPQEITEAKKLSQEWKASMNDK